MVILTSKTDIYEKLSEPCELRLNHPVLKAVDDYHGFAIQNFFLGAYRLSHCWSFNLRPWDHTNIFSYSSSQSRLPLLSLHFCRLLFLHFLFLCVFLFCLLFMHFPLVQRFFPCTLESSGDWQFAFCHTLNTWVFWVNIAKSELSLRYRNCESYLGLWGKRVNFGITIAEIQQKVWERRRKRGERENVEFR